MADYDLTTRRSLLAEIGPVGSVEITLSPQRIYDLHLLTASNTIHGSLDGRAVTLTDSASADKIKLLPPVGGGQPSGSPLRIVGVSTLKLGLVAGLSALIQIVFAGTLRGD